MVLILKSILAASILSCFSVDSLPITRRNFIEGTGATLGAPKVGMGQLLVDPALALPSYPRQRRVEIVPLVESILGKGWSDPPQWMKAEALRRGIRVYDVGFEIVDAEMRVAEEFDLNPRDVHKEVLDIFFGEDRADRFGQERPLFSQGGVGEGFGEFIAEVIRHTSKNGPSNTESTALFSWTEGVWSKSSISSTRDWDSLPGYLKNRSGITRNEMAYSSWHEWRDSEARSHLRVSESLAMEHGRTSSVRAEGPGELDSSNEQQCLRFL